MTYYTQNCSRSIAVSPVGAIEKLALYVRCWIRIQRLRLDLARERRELRSAPDSLLTDIGISRADALAESRREDIPQQRLDSELGRAS